MNATPAKTSVIIPVRNGAKYIAAAMTSALPQLGPADELIVIDDRSADATTSVVASIVDPRVWLLAAPRQGVAAARNAGLARATGEFIAFLDADDLWPEGRHSAMLQHLDGHPHTSAVFGRITIKYEPDAVRQNYEAVDGKYIPNGVLGTGLFRHRIVKQVGGFAEDMLAAEDTDFFNRLQEAGMAASRIERDALIYRRHAANITNDRAFVRKWFLEMLRRKVARGRSAMTPSS